MISINYNYHKKMGPNESRLKLKVNCRINVYLIKLTLGNGNRAKQYETK